MRAGRAGRGAAAAFALARCPPAAAGATARSRAVDCPGWGRPALAADPRPHALRVFAIQFEQHPAR